ncbi:MAG: hypothetical protein JXA54_10975 [Candidatus Heimdallarchaeota archaeon]|nr:hypothetical protein [Candidatus Heimdallarchaeota archaeon]
MSNITIKCKLCSNEYTIEFNKIKRTIKCPNCMITKPLHYFNNDFIIKYSWTSGYEITITEFVRLLEKGKKSKLRRFFRRKVNRLKFMRIKNEPVTFVDRFGNVLSIEQIYQYLQDEPIYQRMIYNLWKSTFKIRAPLLPEIKNFSTSN